MKVSGNEVLSLKNFDCEFSEDKTFAVKKTVLFFSAAGGRVVWVCQLLERWVDYLDAVASIDWMLSISDC